MPPEDMPDRFIDPALQPYVAEFMDDARERGYSLGEMYSVRNVEFVDDLEGTTIGLCSTRSVTNITGRYSWRSIYIKRSFYERTKDRPYDMKWLMYHELAHCILDMDHATDAPPMIMQPMHPYLRTSYMDEFIEDHIDELFHPERSIFTYGDGRSYPTNLSTLSLVDFALDHQIHEEDFGGCGYVHSSEPGVDTNHAAERYPVTTNKTHDY